MAGANQQFIVIFEKERPLRGVEFGRVVGLDSKVSVQLRGRYLRRAHRGRHVVGGSSQGEVGQ